MRQQTRLALAFVPCLVLAAASAGAQQMYKWKDARGVTHYSEKPPANGKYTTHDQVRDPNTQASGAQAASTDAAAQPARTTDDPRCNTARSNLASLQGDAAVQIDNDGDGKPDKTLSEAERQGQINLARSTLEAYNCTESGTAASAATRR